MVFLFANPIDSMSDKIVKLDEMQTEQNLKHRQNIQATINTLTQKEQNLFLLKQGNELLLNEQKTRAVNGK